MNTCDFISYLFEIRNFVWNQLLHFYTVHRLVYIKHLNITIELLDTTS